MKRRDRILYVDNSFTFGGAINALRDLIRGLDRTRFDPVVLSAQSRSFLDAHFADADAHQWPVKLPWVHTRFHRHFTKLSIVSRKPFKAFYDKGRGLIWLGAVDTPEALRIRRFARRSGVRLLHLNNGVESMVPPLVAGLMLRIPIVAHARGPQTTHGMARLCARGPDRWIAVSHSVAENLRASGVPDSRITVIHDAIDTELFAENAEREAGRAELSIPAEAPVFGLFARIIPWKGIAEFVRAAQVVLKEMPDARALVVGDPSDGTQEYYQEVMALAHSLGIGDRVLFTGFRDDVAAVMRMCDVIVHTSIVPEPFGLTVVEGMSVGRPVVAANAGGPTEIVIHGETGFLVNPRNAAEMGSAILRLLRDTDMADEMGRRAARRAREHFSIPVHVRAVQQVYDDLLGAQPAGPDDQITSVSP